MNPDKRIVQSALRAANITPKQVSISCSSETLTATVRDLTTPYAVIREALRKVERIHRDAYTGEILVGGNTYTEIQYSEKIKQAWRETWAQPILDAVAKRHACGDLNTLITVSGAQYFSRNIVCIGRNPANHSDILWTDDFRTPGQDSLRLYIGEIGTDITNAQHPAEILGAWLHRHP